MNKILKRREYSDLKAFINAIHSWIEVNKHEHDLDIYIIIKDGKEGIKSPEPGWKSIVDCGGYQKVKTNNGDIYGKDGY